MRSFRKFSARWWMTSGDVILCLLAFTGGVVAQTAQPKTGQTAPKQPAPAQPAPAQPAWAVICENVQTGLDCRAVQSVRLNDRGGATLNVAVRLPQDTKKPVLLLQLPLGLHLPTGVSVQIGQSDAKVIPFQICDQNGCMAQYAVTEAEIAAMQRGGSDDFSSDPQQATHRGEGSCCRFSCGLRKDQVNRKKGLPGLPLRDKIRRRIPPAAYHLRPSMAVAFRLRVARRNDQKSY